MTTRLLIADGDGAWTDLYRAVFSQQGYQVETAADGLECLAKSRRQQTAWSAWPSCTSSCPVCSSWIWNCRGVEPKAYSPGCATLSIPPRSPSCSRLTIRQPRLCPGS